MEQKNLGNEIKKEYNEVKKMIEKYPGYEKFLDKTIILEGKIGEYLIKTLETKPYGKENPRDTNVYKVYIGGGNGRSGLEKKIMNNVVGESVSINDLLQEGIDSLNKILSMNNLSEKIFEDLKVEVLKLDGVILPPDKKEINIGLGEKHFERKELKINKIGLLILVLREKGIFTDDILVYEGINKNNMMREYSYYAVYIPRVNKTIFINEGYGEATYICDGEISLNEMQKLGKEGLVENYGAKKISFEEKNIDSWKTAIGKNFDGVELKTKVNIKTFKNKIKLVEEIRSKYQTVPEEIKNYFDNKEKYSEHKEEIKEYFGEGMPSSFKGLITLLGGNCKKSRGGDYVKALMKSKEEGEKWLEEQEKNKLSPEEIRSKYQTVSEEIKNYFDNEKKYREHIKEIKEYFGEGMPSSFRGLITLLGGKCKESQSGDYVKALMKSKEEGEKWFVKMKSGEFAQEKIELVEEIRSKYQTVSEEIKNYFDNDKKYSEHKKEIKEYFGGSMPDSFEGLITLLGGDKTQSLSGDYVKALMKSKEEGEKWLEEQAKNKLTPSEIRENYQKCPEEIKNLFNSSKLYGKNKKEIKEYFGEGMPSSFKGLITLLGGNCKESQSGDYVKALMKSKEEGEKWLEEQAKNKLTPSEIRENYQKCPEEIKNLFNSSKLYEKNKKEIKEYFGEGMPSSFKGLITLLGGNCKEIQSGEYVKALMESEEEGEKWLEEQAKNKLTPSEIRENYQKCPEEIKNLFNNATIYGKNKEEIKEYFGGSMPDSFEGLITLLGGDKTQSLSGDYVKALMKSKEEGEKWLEEQAKNKLTPSEIRENYQKCPEEIKNLFNSSKLYGKNKKEIKEYFGGSMPDSFEGLITLLGGDNAQSKSGEYVKALMESEEEGEKWFVKMKSGEFAQEKIELVEEIRSKYQTVSEEIKNYFDNTDKYREHKEEIKEYFGEGMPSSFKGLITLLGGKCRESRSGDYVKALMKSKEEGEKWFVKMKSGEFAQEKIELVEEIRSKYQTVPEGIKNYFDNGVKYQANKEEIKEYFGEGMPSSFQGLITLLGGNCKKSQGGDYVKALMKSKEEGEKWLEEHNRN